MNNTGSSNPYLGGRYRILRQLSQGGFGHTYLAEDTNRFQELCVLREFNPQVEGKLALDKAQILFEQEASLLYQLNHPQIPRFRELLREGNRLFLVQDYVEGPTYRDVLNRRKAQGERFSETEVAQLLMQLLPVLQYLHGVGIVHGDISPDNLIQRNADGRPVLIDFSGVKQVLVNVRYQLGVAQPYQSTTGEITRLGRVGYAPETQLESGQVNPADDLYALGVTALVLLTGEEPAALYDSRHQRWIWPNYAEVSPRLAEVLNRLVALDSPQRFESAGQVMAALNLASPYADSPGWSTPMPVRIQPATPPPPLSPPPPTVAVAPGPPLSSPGYYYPAPVDPTYTVPPPPRPTRPKSSSSTGCLSALAGLIGILTAAVVLWWWLDPLDWRLGSSNQTIPEENATDNPALSEAEQARKQALKERTAALGVEPAFLISLTDQIFFEQNPDLQGTQLTDRPEDAARRAEWDAIAAANLDMLEANLSTEARGKLGSYTVADRDRWQSQVNERYVSSKALYDLTNARFNQLFPGRPQQGFVETPIDQIWFGLAQDRVNALVKGDALTEIRFEPGTFSQELEGNLDPGGGHVYILNLSAGQLMRLNLQAPPGSTRLSLYVPVPSPELPHLLANAEQNTWAGELPQSGYYEIVVISQAQEPIPYRLTVGVDNVFEDILNRPAPPAKTN